MLNLIQHPSSRLAQGYPEKWTLKQVQGDEGLGFNL